jgi:hypothetical protein
MGTSHRDDLRFLHEEVTRTVGSRAKQLERTELLQFDENSFQVPRNKGSSVFQT